MRELTGVLEREAARVVPRPNLDDVIRRAGRRRRRGRALGTVASILVVAALGVAMVSLAGGGERVVTTADGQPAPVDVATVGGLILADAGPDVSFPAGTIERHDSSAGEGSQTLVLRRPGGDLSQGTVVVSYPWSFAPGPDGEPQSWKGEQVGQTGLTRSLGAVGRIQFVAIDVSSEELLRLADAVVVEDGRPIFRPELFVGPGSWRPVAAGPSRAPLVAEARYGCDSLGEADALGAMCYVAVTASPGFEAALLAQTYQPGPEVDGRPSAVSTVGGGSGTLAWELEPGVIAYVGYSGNVLGPDQVAALGRLAQRVERLDPEAWASTRPQVGEQKNDWIHG